MSGERDIEVDFRFFEMALEYLQRSSEEIVQQVADTAAARHLLAHARAFGSGVPTDSAAALVRQLLSSGSIHDVAALRQVLAKVRPGVERKEWLRDSLTYLPDSARLGGALFLTYGYDCGVAYPPNASVNLAFPWFRDHPDQVVYYCIHEVHHAGFYSLQPPPGLEDIRTCGDLLRVVQYLTHLEGTAVLAAYPRRKADRAFMDWSGDYEALEDTQRLRELAFCYFSICESLGIRGSEECSDEDMAVFELMSGGDRLWYRVGCMMARAIEEEKGRAALNHLIEAGPAAFFEEYQGLAGSCMPGS